MATDQEVMYHRSLLSPAYLESLNPPQWFEKAKRQVRDIEALRLRDPQDFEERRKRLAPILNVAYKPGYMQTYPGDQGGQDRWVSGVPSDAQVAECMAPLYPPQSVVKSPTTGMVALPIIGWTRKALMHGRALRPAEMFEKIDQQFENYATPWEREWSDLSPPYNRGFTPIVDNSWTVVGYQGTTSGVAPGKNSSQSCLIVPRDCTGISLETAIEKGVPVFVQSGARLPAGWTYGNFFTTEHRLQVQTGLDGEVLSFRATSTGFLIQPWYSPMDIYCAAKILVGLTKLGVRMGLSLARRTAANLERKTLSGATEALAKDAVKSAAKSAAKDEAKIASRVVSESELAPLRRVKGSPSRKLSPSQMESFLRDKLQKRPYLRKLSSVRGNDSLMTVISEWEKNTGKGFLKVSKGTPTRLGSEGAGGWARDAVTGQEIMIIERDVFKNEAQATIEVVHELAYEAVREGADLAMPHLDIPLGSGGLRNAMQWLEAYIQHGERAFETLRSLGRLDPTL